MTYKVLREVSISIRRFTEPMNTCAETRVANAFRILTTLLSSRPNEAIHQNP